MIDKVNKDDVKAYNYKPYIRISQFGKQLYHNRHLITYTNDRHLWNKKTFYIKRAQIYKYAM